MKGAKRTWPLRKAKAEFAKLIDGCVKNGPQVVTRRGVPVVVMIRVSEYEKLRRAAPDFKEFLRSAPSLHELDLTRNQDTGREIDL